MLVRLTALSKIVSIESLELRLPSDACKGSKIVGFFAGWAAEHFDSKKKK
jgi:hypothetical protein